MDKLNREIYIKIEPTKTDISNEDAKNFITVSTVGNDLALMESELGDQFDEIIAMALEKFREMFHPYVLDWTGCDSFWTLKETDKGITMNEHSLTGQGITKEYKSKEEISKEFMSLNSFVESGKYIGRFFRRTRIANPEDKEFLPVDHNTFALYENSGVILVVRNDNGKNVFRVISKRFTQDNNYEYYGEQKPSYDNEREMKRAITKQLTHNN